MASFECEVYIRPHKDILDPQGDAVEKALHNLGFTTTAQVRVGRYVMLTLEAADEAAARAAVEEMCAKLLANPVTEDYELKVK